MPDDVKAHLGPGLPHARHRPGEHIQALVWLKPSKQADRGNGRHWQWLCPGVKAMGDDRASLAESRNNLGPQVLAVNNKRVCPSTPCVAGAVEHPAPRCRPGHRLSWMRDWVVDGGHCRNPGQERERPRIQALMRVDDVWIEARNLL